MAFIEVAKLKDLEPGQAKHVKANNQEIAIFNVDGNIYATTNICLHVGGPLGEGNLEGNTITCPWHGWQYDVINGQCKTIPTFKLQTYKVKIENGKIMVDV
ncbi:non-heme iron oxygenase ferredoxin subunit [Candidatus Woesearchaeota archaeon]|nr:non-heme iron oxygenase ferredoxin subunit [Candidatus Woesearchaeota archaeon]